MNGSGHVVLIHVSSWTSKKICGKTVTPHESDSPKSRAQPGKTAAKYGNIHSFGNALGKPSMFGETQLVKNALVSVHPLPLEFEASLPPEAPSKEKGHINPKRERQHRAPQQANRLSTQK